MILKKSALIAFVFILVSCALYMKQELFIYYWDYQGFFTTWGQLVQLFENNIVGAFDSIRASLKHDDYNRLSIIIPSLFGVVFGTSRTVFITSLVICYILPLSLCFGYLIKTITKQQVNTNFFAISAIFLCALFPAIWIPTLRGYPGVSALIPFTIIFIELVKNNLVEINVKKALIIGCCTWLMFALRRWYAYTVVALFIVMPLFNYFYHENKIEKKKIIILLSNFAIAGITASLLAFVLQHSLIKRVLTTSYADIYSGYNFGIKSALTNLANYSGLLFIAFSAILLLIALIYGNKKSRYFNISCLCILVIAFFIFTRTQTPGMQHCMPFEFLILIVFTVSLTTVSLKIKNINRQKILPVCCVGLFLITFLTTLYPQFRIDGFVGRVLPVKHYPMVQASYDTYHQIAKDISALDSDVAIFASSGILNDDLIRNAMSEKDKHHVIWVPHVDLRDKIFVTPYMCEYAIVANPIQTHLHPESQLVITNPASSIINHENIGKSYTAVKTYTLENNVQAVLYKKDGKCTRTDVQKHLERFFDKYQEWFDEFNTPIFKAAMSMYDIRKGDQWGGFWFDGNTQTLNTHPGETYSTKFSIPSGIVKGITFKSTNTACNIDDFIQITISNSNESKIYHLPHGGTLEINDLDIDKSYSFDISKEKSSGCDSVSMQMH